MLGLAPADQRPIGAVGVQVTHQHEAGVIQATDRRHRSRVGGGELAQVGELGRIGIAHLVTVFVHRIAQCAEIVLAEDLAVATLHDQQQRWFHACCRGAHVGNQALHGPLIEGDRQRKAGRIACPTQVLELLDDAAGVLQGIAVSALAGEVLTTRHTGQHLPQGGGEGLATLRVADIGDRHDHGIGRGRLAKGKLWQPHHEAEQQSGDQQT